MFHRVIGKNFHAVPRWRCYSARKGLSISLAVELANELKRRISRSLNSITIERVALIACLLGNNGGLEFRTRYWTIQRIAKFISWQFEKKCLNKEEGIFKRPFDLGKKKKLQGLLLCNIVQIGSHRSVSLSQNRTRERANYGHRTCLVALIPKYALEPHKKNSLVDIVRHGPLSQRS